MTAPFSDLQAVAPSSIIELYQLELNAAQHGTTDIYRFHAGTNANATGDIIWAGNSYLRFPIETEGFEYSGNGQLPRPKVRVSNIMGTITALLLSLPRGLEGAKFTRIRTLARYIDAVNFPGNVNPYGTPNSAVEFPREIYYVDQKTTENRDIIEFELAAAFDLAGIRAPKRQCIANICQWQYRSAECSYTGTRYFGENDQPVGSLALDVCGKRLNSCLVRFSAVSDFPTAGTTNRLLVNQTLASGSQLVSSNGWYRLLMQTDGNLVIYTKAGTVLWATGTNGAIARLVLQSDGNLVVYRNSDNQALWASNTVGSASSYLEMQTDGNLVLYTSANAFIWGTSTNQNGEPSKPAPELPFGSFPGIGTYFS